MNENITEDYVHPDSMFDRKYYKRKITIYSLLSLFIVLAITSVLLV